jgi:hypothetical protein
MSNRQKMPDGRVDAFVAAVNASDTLKLPCDSIPEPCRLVEDNGFCNWRIVPSQGASWILSWKDSCRLVGPSPFVLSLLAICFLRSFAALCNSIR